MTTILGISGSLRRGSYNSALLRAAAEFMPEGATLEMVLWSEGRLLVPRSSTAFDDQGRLVDETLRERLRNFMHGFVDFVRRVQPWQEQMADGLGAESDQRAVEAAEAVAAQ